MIFQYFLWQIKFSRTFQESPLNSSTFQACANPGVISCSKEALAIRRIFSLVDIITKPKFSNRPNVFKIGLFG